MSKKHFIYAAKFILNEYVVCGKLAEANAAAELVIRINDNAAFDKGRFLAACGL